MPLFCHILGGFAHAVGMVHCRKFAVNKAPAQGGIFHLERPPVEGALGLTHHERGAGHALDPTGHKDFALVRPDCLGGVVDRLRQLGVDVIEVQFGSQATPSLGQTNREKARYFNKRAEIWGSVRDWLRGGALPPDPQLLEGLCGPKQKISGEDVIQLERKAEAIQRMEKEGIEFDMDSADALAITMAIDTSWYTGVGVEHGHFPVGQVEGLDHNPYSDFRTYM